MAERLRRIVAEELTAKQRTARVAIGIRGMPADEIASRMGIHRNALCTRMRARAADAS